LSARRLFGLGSLAFVAAAFATRAGQSLGYDELFTVWVSSRSPVDLIHQANLDGFTPPAFYALVKAFSLAGLSNENLRVVSIGLAGLAVFLGLQATERLFGPASRWPALFLIPGSAYLFTFAHELRPYSALLCCAFFFLGELGGPPSGKSDLKAAVAALVATSFSYLGASMVALWLFECRRRCARLSLALVSLLCVLLCAPGLQKAFTLAASSIDSQIAWSAVRPALSPVFFGLAPFPFDARIELLAVILLILLLLGAHYPKSLPAQTFLTRAFGVFTFGVLALDAFVPIGFAPRYFALPMAALLLLIAGVLTRAGRAGLLIAAVILCLNGLAVFRYLTIEPSPREDWRGAMARFEARLGSTGVLLAFPFHHAAVAARAYAPGLAVGGGYTSRTGPVFWYEPPASFGGYSFDGLKRLDDAGEAFRRLALASDVCVISDEPDIRKTAALFGVFEALGRAEPFDTGDPRLRALCRRRG
jgi:hypothetical protein